jgi:azurin
MITKIFVCAVLVSSISSLALAATDNIKISTKHNELFYNKTSLSVKAKDTVKVTFKNGTSKDAGLQHNWVLVKPNTADQVATAGISAGASKDWLPDSPDIIAHTKLLNSGESETVSFTAPAAGDYPYICTYPGHAQTMKGVLHVK